VNWKSAKLIFYLGTFVSLGLFLVLTYDTHRQVETLTHTDKLSPEVIAGKRVWHKYNCNDCHTILGFGSYYAPDMTKAYWRLGAEGIKRIVREPEKYTTWRKMPRFAVSDAELDNLVAFLSWTSAIDTNDWPPQDQKLNPELRPRSGAPRAVAAGLSAGAALFQEKGCFTCHRLNETGGTMGPDLTRVGSRLPQETIAKILTDPRSVKPDGIMPPTPMSGEEKTALTGFLVQMK
jgi:nitric oxide reductase subunit C